MKTVNPKANELRERDKLGDVTNRVDWRIVENYERPAAILLGIVQIGVKICANWRVLFQGWCLLPKFKSNNSLFMRLETLNPKSS